MTTSGISVGEARSTSVGPVSVRRVSAELQSIQALRAIAATSVILVHIPFIGKGAFGVDIFFVISGFIICYISSLNSDDFLLKRVFRIVPLYWLGTFGVFLLALVVPAWLNATTANLTDLAKSLFLIPYKREDGGTFPMLFLGWTLEYEMFFYFAFGLALVFFKKWTSLAASILLAARGGGRRGIPPVFDHSAFLLQPHHRRVCAGHGGIRHLEALSEFVEPVSGGCGPRPRRRLLYLPLPGRELCGPK